MCSLNCLLIIEAGVLFISTDCTYLGSTGKWFDLFTKALVKMYPGQK